MIIDLIAQVFISIGNFFINLMPSWSLPEGMTTGISNVINNALAYDKIFPVVQLMAVVTAVLVFYAVIFAWRGIHWLLNIIRGN